MHFITLKTAISLIVLLLALICTGCAQHRLPDPIAIPHMLPPAPPLDHVQVALVLSGGGARGLAHAGVIEVLEKHHIPVDVIVGSSADSVVGALYADDPNAGRLKKKLIALNKWHILDVDWYASVKMFWQLSGPVSGNAFKRFVHDNMSATHFTQLKIPLVVVATDLYKGESFVMRSGPLVPALHASSAIPMVFDPVKMYGRTLIDGAVASPVPVEVAKSFSPKFIIAVDLGTSPSYGPVNNMYQLGMRSLVITYHKLAAWQNQQADIVIRPEIDKFSMFDDSANHDLYEAGKKAAEKALPQIQQALQQLAHKKQAAQ